MTSFVLYMGIPGSGKSYLAHQNEDKYVIIDSDEVRARILGDATNQTQNARVFEHMFRETCECLQREVDCAYVATNLSMKRRMNLLISLKKKFPNVKYECRCVIAPLDVCHMRNAMRERSVPTYVIDRMVRQFDPPCENEGWDNIYIELNFPKESSNFITYRHKYTAMVENYGNQQNSHHQLTLQEHCKKCGDLATKHDCHTDICCACYYHDYGKALTGIRWEKDNYKEMHYPNHAEVGAYMVLTMGYNLHIAQLIRFHMIPYMDATAQKTWCARIGEKLWEEIQIIHLYDELAHQEANYDEFNLCHYYSFYFNYN